MATPETALLASTTHRVPVTLGPDGILEYTVVADLKSAARSGHEEIDVLLHGGTYSGSYWDWPQDERYSMVTAFARGGRDTLVVDRLGSGRSSVPHSTLLTADATASALHQVTQWVRRARGYQRVNVVGHSLGSLVAAAYAARYPDDLDALVLTGVLHGPVPLTSEAGEATTPASADPLLRGRGHDPGYVTIAGEVRDKMMYHHADPAVAAWDAERRDAFSVTEFITSTEEWLAPPESNASAGISAPVYLLAGDHDALFFGYPGAPDPDDLDALREQEQRYFPSAKSLDADTVPDTGHCLNLHPSAQTTFGMISGWLHHAH
jgi:pimeloyl-ACP methyl ester carboxylesterase